jgi:hypothetical protein
MRTRPSSPLTENNYPGSERIDRDRIRNVVFVSAWKSQADWPFRNSEFS